MKNKKVIEIDSKEGEKIMQQILSKPPVVLVGAAISMWNPTNLPFGSKISNQMFDLLFPKSLFKQEEYKKCKSIIKDYFLGSERKKNENEEENTENKKKSILGLPFEVIFEGCPKKSKQKLVSIFKKAFSIRECNPVHKALRDHLLSDGFPAIITTNYDLCLDEVLDVSDSHPVSSEVVRVIEKQDIEQSQIHNKKKIYFKLHGSVDDAEGRSLVFSLRQERRLPEWKKRLLYKLFKRHQSLLVIGYSGSDFEICPELFSKKSPLKKIFWNIREVPSINAKRFAGRKDHINTLFLEGDMRKLLSELRSTEVNARKEGPERRSLVSYIDSEFNSQELALWRIALLKRMGIPKPALKDYEKLEMHSLTPAERIEAKTMKGRLYFHNGKYKTSAYLLEKTAKKAIEIGRAE